MASAAPSLTYVPAMGLHRFMAHERSIQQMFRADAFKATRLKHGDGSMKVEFTDDGDGDALRRVAEGGADTIELLKFERDLDALFNIKSFVGAR